MKIELNNKNEIVSVSYIGPLLNGIEIPYRDLGDLEDERGYYKYSYINDEIVINETSSLPNLKLLRDLRVQRKHLLQTFDIYKTNVIYGIEIETEEQKEELLNWYNNLLDLQENSLDNVPECIKRYL